MSVHFADAATRHLRDARTLRPSSPANARYLAGYVVECALKVVVQRANVPGRPFGHDLLHLSGAGLDLALALVPTTSRYRPDRTHVQAVRDRWTEHARYERSDESPATMVDAVVTHAGAVYEATIAAMILDGVLELTPDANVR